MLKMRRKMPQSMRFLNVWNTNVKGSFFYNQQLQSERKDCYSFKKWVFLSYKL